MRRGQNIMRKCFAQFRNTIFRQLTCRLARHIQRYFPLPFSTSITFSPSIYHHAECSKQSRATDHNLIIYRTDDETDEPGARASARLYGFHCRPAGELCCCVDRKNKLYVLWRCCGTKARCRYHQQHNDRRN